MFEQQKPATNKAASLACFGNLEGFGNLKGFGNLEGFAPPVAKAVETPVVQRISNVLPAVQPVYSGNAALLAGMPYMQQQQLLYPQQSQQTDAQYGAVLPQDADEDEEDDNIDDLIALCTGL